MKNKFKIALLMSALLLAGCNVAKQNGKSASDYDLSNNSDSVCYLKESVDCGDVSIQCYVNSAFMSAHKDMFKVDVKKKNNSVKKYDIVEVYYTDLEGNNSVKLLDNPVSCDFKKSSEYCSISENFDDKAVDLSKTEFHVITENKNITVHGWEPVYYYEEASTDLKVDASKNTNEFPNSLTSAKFKSKSLFSMDAEIIQGKWCGDFLRLNVNANGYGDMSISNIYLTDYKYEKTFNVLDKPIKTVNKRIYYEVPIKEQDLNIDLSQKYRIHVVTDAGVNAIFRNWDFAYETSNKSKESYEISSNETFIGKYSETINYNDNKSIEIGRDNDCLTMKFSGMKGEKYDVVTLAYTDENNEIVTSFLANPISLLLGYDEMFVLEIKDSNLTNKKDYDKLYLTLVTEDANIIFNLTSDVGNSLQPNGKSKTDYVLNDIKYYGELGPKYDYANVRTCYVIQDEGLYEVVLESNVGYFLDECSIQFENYTSKDLDIVEASIKDQNKEHVLTFVDEPITVGAADSENDKVIFNGLNSSFLNSCNGQITLSIVTPSQEIIVVL